MIKLSSSGRHIVAQEFLEEAFSLREAARKARGRLRELESYISEALLCGAEVQAGEYEVSLGSGRTGERARRRVSVSRVKAQQSPDEGIKHPSKLIPFRRQDAR